MAVTIVEEARPITGGVDTHADMHVAAALDSVGGLLGVREFPATAAGDARLLGWLGGFGTVALVGIEGTGSYVAGLARHVTAAGIRVVEVDRSDRQDRRRQGKSDPLDAVSAARAAQSGRDGAVEAIRALIVARRSAAGRDQRPAARRGDPAEPHRTSAPGRYRCSPRPASPAPRAPRPRRPPGARVIELSPTTSTGKIERLHQSLQDELLDVHGPFERRQCL